MVERFYVVSVLVNPMLPTTLFVLVRVLSLSCESGLTENGIAGQLTGAAPRTGGTYPNLLAALCQLPRTW